MIDIRKAKLKDADLVVDMWKVFIQYFNTEKLIDKNPKLKPHFAKKKEADKIFRQYIKRCIRSRNSLLNIAYVDNKPAGYSLLHIKNNIPVFKIEKLGYIGDLYVKKEYRGLGISSKFKDAAVEWFKKKKLKYMSICVFPGNEKAYSIYKHWGFFDYHLEMRRKI